MKLTLAAFILFSFFHLTLNGQVYSIMQDLQEDEKKSIEAIALYPEVERNAILEASTQPEILIRMQNIQRKTEKQFREIILDLKKEDQEKIYNLSRYPELIESICAKNEKNTKKEIEELTLKYPEEIKEEAQFINRKFFDELQEINALYLNTQSVYQDLLKPYDRRVQLAYGSLLQLPEVVGILTDNMSLTVLLGDAYEKNPEALKKELDSLNVILAEKKAQELQEWKDYLEENPEAMKEFEQASQEFAEDQGYTKTVYDDNYYNERVIQEIYVYPYWQPYPYWFGWPYWYTYECWYPYPWWYHWGYYYSPGNVIIFVGLPSTYFMNWHFAYYSHFYYYPHFTNLVVNYYYENPDQNNSISSSVERWERETSDELPTNWLQNKGDRTESIREYGKFKMEYNSTVRNLNNGTPTQKEYLKSNRNQYPLLEPIMKDNERPSYSPSYDPEKIKSREIIQPRQKVIEQKSFDYQKIDRARIYHQNIWNKPSQRKSDYSSPQNENPKDRDNQKTPKTKSPQKK
jgi:hypothetical protein